MAKSKGRYAILAADFWRHPKIEALSLEAAGLLAKAISYSADQMTDGMVPGTLIRAWAGKRTNRIVRELTTVHLNRPGGHSSPILSKFEDGFFLNTYLKRNISSGDYRAFLASDRERKQKVNENFQDGNQPESDPEAGEIPAGDLVPRIKTLSRERESADPDVPGRKKGDGILDRPPHLQVTGLWVNIGREVANDPRVYADPEIEKKSALKLWARGKQINPADPLAALRGPFRSYWKKKRENGQWPKMQFMIVDFNEHLDASEKEAQAKTDQQEYELRQKLITLHGRAKLLKTSESKEEYEKIRLEYREYVSKKKAAGAGR